MRNVRQTICRALLAALAGLPVVAFAVEFKTMESFGRQVHYEGSATAAPSSHTVTGLLMSYSVRAVGGDVTFRIKSSSGTDTTWTVNASSDIVVKSGGITGETYRTVAYNPLVLLSSIASGATAYVDIIYMLNARGGP